MSTRPASPGPRVRRVVAVVLAATLLAPYAPLLLAIGPPSSTGDPSADDGPTGVFLIFAFGFLLVGAVAVTGTVLSVVGATMERSGRAAPVRVADDTVLRGEAPLQRWHRAVGLVLVASAGSFGAVELVAALAVAALAAGTGDDLALRRVAAPVRLLPLALAAAGVGLVAFIAATVVSAAGGS